MRPARAPFLFDLFQKSARIITGPNVAPNPAHAKLTIWKTELFGFQASTTPITPIRQSASLEIVISFFSGSFAWKHFTRISEVIEDDAQRSCESAVDIVDARIPESTTPAITAKMAPWLARRSDIFIITVSESEPESAGMQPSPLIASPTTPIQTDTAIEIRTQTVATLLESESFFSSSIAMNLSRICGIPKYPSPHARVEMI